MRRATRTTASSSKSATITGVLLLILVILSLGGSSFIMAKYNAHKDEQNLRKMNYKSLSKSYNVLKVQHASLSKSNDILRMNHTLLSRHDDMLTLKIKTMKNNYTALSNTGKKLIKEIGQLTTKLIISDSKKDTKGQVFEKLPKGTRKYKCSSGQGPSFEDVISMHRTFSSLANCQFMCDSYPKCNMLDFFPGSCRIYTSLRGLSKSRPAGDSKRTLCQLVKPLSNSGDWADAPDKLKIKVDYSLTSPIYKRLTEQIQKLKREGKPLLIKVNSFPCAGKSYFIKRNSAKYKGLTFRDMDDTRFGPGRTSASLLVPGSSKNTILFGTQIHAAYRVKEGGNEKEKLENIVYINVIPTLPQIRLNIEIRARHYRKNTKNINEAFKYKKGIRNWWNATTVLNARTQALTFVYKTTTKDSKNKQTSNSGTWIGSNQLEPVFATFEEATYFCFNAYNSVTRVVPIQPTSMLAFVATCGKITDVGGVFAGCVGTRVYDDKNALVKSPSDSMCCKALPFGSITNNKVVHSGTMNDTSSDSVSDSVSESISDSVS